MFISINNEQNFLLLPKRKTTLNPYPISAVLPKSAHALRPLKILKSGDGRHYTAHTFPKGGYEGCELTLRRCEAFGYLVPQPGSLVGDLFIDVLDIEGDILNTIGLTARGWNYLRRVLKFRRESTELAEAFDTLAATASREIGHA